jgi:hypothetical protein
MEVPAGPAVGATSVTCDQAVFSSVRTPTGQGYRIIAASKGLTPEEKRDITTRSPSHGGLCDEGPDASAVAFYRLSSGRLALSYSCDAGAEHTGRGVRRIYTHISVISMEDFARFGFNPSNVLMAVDACGALHVQLEPPRILDALVLAPSDRADADRAAAAAERCGANWVAYALSLVLGDQRVVTGGTFDPGDWVEAVLFGIPGPMRADVSFSAGLRYTVGRPYGLSAVNGDLTKARHMVRGQRVIYLEPETQDAAPPAQDSPWLRMVESHYREGRCAALAEITSQPIPDCSVEALDRIAAITLDTNTAASIRTRDLLQLAEARADLEAMNAFEAALLNKLLKVIQNCLCDRLRHECDVQPFLPDLTRLLQQSRRAADLVLPAVGLAIQRLTTTAPHQAAAFALEALGACRDPRHEAALRPRLPEVLSGFRAWVLTAGPKDLEAGRAILAEWHFKHLESDESAAILAQIDTRLQTLQYE